MAQVNGLVCVVEVVVVINVGFIDESGARRRV